MSKIRILYFVDCLEHGGIQSLLWEIIKRLDKNEFEISILSFDFNRDYELEKVMTNMGVNIYKIPRPEKQPFKCLKMCKQIFKDNCFDVVHCHSSSKSAIVLKYAYKYNVKLRIVHAHSDHFQSSNVLKKIIGHILFIPTCRYANKYMACSKNAAKLMFKHFYAKKIEPIIVNNAIDLSRFQYSKEYREDIRKMYNINDDTFVLGHIGRFVRVKNHLFLIDIFNDLLKLKPNSQLIFVGDGELLDKCKQKVNDLKINDKVIFAGYQSVTEKFYSAFDAFILPSLYEGLPIVGVEAQASGLPCYFSNKITDSVNICSDNCHIVDIKKSSEDWAKIINKTKLNYERLKAIDVLSKVGFNINEVVNYLTELYKNNLKQ